MALRPGWKLFEEILDKLIHTDPAEMSSDEYYDLLTMYYSHIQARMEEKLPKKATPRIIQKVIVIITRSYEASRPDELKFLRNQGGEEEIECFLRQNPDWILYPEPITKQEILATKKFQQDESARLTLLNAMNTASRKSIGKSVFNEDPYLPYEKRNKFN